MKKDFIKITVKKIIEELNQEINPMLFITTQGKYTVVPLNADKDLWPYLIKGAIDIWGASEYILVTEAYQAKIKPESEFAKKLLSGEMAVKDLPADKREDIVSILYVLSTGKASMASAIIDTNAEGKRSLRQWKTMKDVTGRFVLTAWEIKKASVKPISMKHYLPSMDQDRKISRAFDS